jgi:4-hydroxy-3-polyprenylbenzoate decarboxylase
LVSIRRLSYEWIIARRGARREHKLRAVRMATTDLVVAVTGASGSPYAVRLVEVLLRAGRTVHLTVSPAAVEVFEREIGRVPRLDAFAPEDLLGELAGGLDVSRLRYHHFRDFQSGIASGSFLTGGMVVCPCSMGTLAAIAHGVSENLIHRAADVHLKERRKLILVPRETPLGLIALRNMVSVTEAGAVVLPAMPAFYTRPASLADMVDFVVGRVCDQLGVENRLLERWGT